MSRTAVRSFVAVVAAAVLTVGAGLLDPAGASTLPSRPVTGGGSGCCSPW